MGAFLFLYFKCGSCSDFDLGPTKWKEVIILTRCERSRNWTHSKHMQLWGQECFQTLLIYDCCSLQFISVAFLGHLAVQDRNQCCWEPACASPPPLFSYQMVEVAQFYKSLFTSTIWGLNLLIGVPHYFIVKVRCCFYLFVHSVTKSAISRASTSTFQQAFSETTDTIWHQMDRNWGSFVRFVSLFIINYNF